jgi:hypothetical protein
VPRPRPVPRKLLHRPLSPSDESRVPSLLGPPL